MSEGELKGTGKWPTAFIAGCLACIAANQLWHCDPVHSGLWGLLFFFVLMLLFSFSEESEDSVSAESESKPEAHPVAEIAVPEAPVAEVAATKPVAAAPRSFLTPDVPVSSMFDASSGGNRPEKLTGPRGGKADDLKIIKGIGPKLERLCHELGFFHFDQIAAWSQDEVMWVDVNLEGFKGRVMRDRWVAQAKAIVDLGQDEFLKQLAEGKAF